MYDPAGEVGGLGWPGGGQGRGEGQGWGRTGRVLGRRGTVFLASKGEGGQFFFWPPGCFQIYVCEVAGLTATVLGWRTQLR